MAPTLGLVGGAGTIPALMAKEARRAGWRIVAFALGDPGDLRAVADRVVPCRFGEVAPVLAALTEEGIRHVVLAGRVWKGGLFQGTSLDGAARALIGQSPDWTDEGLLRTAVGALEAMGIEVVDQRRFLAAWLAPEGPVAGPPPGAATLADITRGLRVARELGRLGVGQTVVVRAGSVAAVEGMEGTDAAIRRGLALAGAGAVVVKATSPEHDYRFDAPAVGRETFAACVEGRAAALAVEAGRVLVLDRDALAADAASGAVSVVGARSAA